MRSGEVWWLTPPPPRGLPDRTHSDTRTSGTAGAAPNRVVMLDTGNLVMYDAAWNVVWSTPTQGNPGASLTMQNDGNAVIYAADGVTPLWHTQTHGH